MTGTRRFRRAQRLGGQAFAGLLASAKPKRARDVSVQSRSNGMKIARLGLIVPKRLLSRAVDRNRARRLLREWFRNNQRCFGGRDLLVRIIARPTDLRSLADEVARLCPGE